MLCLFYLLLKGLISAMNKQTFPLKNFCAVLLHTLGLSCKSEYTEFYKPERIVAVYIEKDRRKCQFLRQCYEILKIESTFFKYHNFSRVEFQTTTIGAVFLLHFYDMV